MTSRLIGYCGCFGGIKERGNNESIGYICAWGGTTETPPLIDNAVEAPPLHFNNAQSHYYLSFGYADESIHRDSQIKNTTGIMATTNANETVNGTSKVSSYEPQTIDAKIVSYDIAPDGKIIWTFDKEFDTLNRNGQLVKTKTMTKHPYAFLRHIEDAPMYRGLRLLATDITAAKKDGKRYEINDLLFVKLLTGAEVKFTKTFKAKSDLRQNGDEYGNDILQADIIAVNAPAFDDGSKTAILNVVKEFKEYAELLAALSDGVVPTVVVPRETATAANIDAQIAAQFS